MKTPGSSSKETLKIDCRTVTRGETTYQQNTANIGKQTQPESVREPEVKTSAMKVLPGKRQQILANSAKKTMVAILSGAHMCRFLLDLNIEAIGTQCDADELKAFAHRASEASEHLSKLAASLRSLSAQRQRSS